MNDPSFLEHTPPRSGQTGIVGRMETEVDSVCIHAGSRGPVRASTTGGLASSSRTTDRTPACDLRRYCTGDELVKNGVLDQRDTEN